MTDEPETKPVPEVPEGEPDETAPEAVPGVVSPFTEAGERDTLRDRIRDAAGDTEVTPPEVTTEDPDAGSDPS